MTFSRILPLALLFFTACAGNNLGRPRIPDLLSASSPLVLYQSADFNRDYVIYKVAMSVCSHATAAENCNSKLLRDQIINRILLDVEINYREYANQLFIGRANWNVGLDTLQLGLSTAATLAGAEFSKTILSAIATGTQGIRLSFDENFLGDKTIPVIIAKMEVLREADYTEIKNKMTMPAAEYQLEEAWTDIVRLFYDGTLVGAVQALMSDAGLATQQMRLQRSQRLEQRLSTMPIPKP